MAYPNNPITVLAGSTDLPPYRRIAFDGTDWELAAAGAVFQAITINHIETGEYGPANAKTQVAEAELEAAGAFASGAALYGAANGTVDDAVSGATIGVALEAATAAGDVVRVILKFTEAA